MGYLAGLALALVTESRRGAVTAVVSGTAAAAIGLATVAAAPGTVVLAVGVFVAASSSGSTWTPFNGITERSVASDRSDSTLAIVSTGTAVGLAGTGLLALVVVAGDVGWRGAWWSFAVIATVVALVDRRALGPGWSRHTGTRGVAALRRAASVDGAPRWWLVGAIAGAANSIWIAFAVDAVVAAGGDGPFVAAAVGPVMFVVLGVSGLAALATGRLIARWSLALTTRAALVAMSSSLVLVGASPGRHLVAVISAAAQGVGIMTASACLAAACLRIHDDQPVEGFTLALAGVALGNIVGAVVTGVVAELVGLDVVLVAVGLVLAGVSVAATRGRGRPDVAAVP